MQLQAKWNYKAIEFEYSCSVCVCVVFVQFFVHFSSIICLQSIKFGYAMDKKCNLVENRIAKKTKTEQKNDNTEEQLQEPQILKQKQTHSMR